MVPFQHALSPVLAQVPAQLLFLALLGASLVLIFAGRTLAKVVAFLVVGFVGAAFGGQLAAQYLPPPWAVLFMVIGFAVGGLLGVVLLPLGVGLVVGYAGYLVALDLVLGHLPALVAGAALFAVGALLSGKILGAATALVGGFLLFGVLTHYGFDQTLATLVAAFLAIMGLWLQLAPDRRPAPPTTTSVGGQPGDRR